MGKDVPVVPHRPRVEPEPELIGLTRRLRTRRGAQLFRWCVLLIFAVIAIDLVVRLVSP